MIAGRPVPLDARKKASLENDMIILYIVISYKLNQREWFSRYQQQWG